MRALLLGCLVIFVLVATVIVTSRAVNGQRNATLCQDALTRRRQAEQIMIGPSPSGDALYGWNRQLAEARRRHAEADVDRQRYC